MGWPNPKGDDTQVVDALTRLASQVSGRCDCKHYSLARVFSTSFEGCSRDRHWLRLLQLCSFSVCDVCDSCLFCNVWLKKQLASTPLTSAHGSGAIVLKPVDPNVSNSLAAFQQLHNRLVSVEEAVHGSADGRCKALW